VVRAPGAALAARLSCGARSLGIERSWWRREWRERELITLVTGYNVSMFAALCRGGRLSVRGAVSVGLCSRTIALLRQPKISSSIARNSIEHGPKSAHRHLHHRHLFLKQAGVSLLMSPCGNVHTHMACV